MGAGLVGVRVEAVERDVVDPRGQAGVDELGDALELLGQSVPG